MKTGLIFVAGALCGAPAGICGLVVPPARRAHDVHTDTDPRRVE